MYRKINFSKTFLFFEWDEKKEKANFKKHGVKFNTSVKIFYDPNLIVRKEKRNNEIRYDYIGKAYKLLYVVASKRFNKIRIISSRLATSNERKIYEHCKD